MLSMILSVLSVGKNDPTPTSTPAAATTGKPSMCSKSALKCGGHGTAYMLPSSIYHMNSGTDNLLTTINDRHIVDVSRTIAENGQLPKLQVVEKDGCWFALNNAQLDLCRRLERDGKCRKVKVDIVPLSSIPRVVLGLMMIPRGDGRDPECPPSAAASDPSRTTAKGYERLEQNEGVEDEDKEDGTDSEELEEEGEEEESCSEVSSDFVDSDSECDWSDDDPDSSGLESSETDGSQSTDDERECLL